MAHTAPLPSSLYRPKRLPRVIRRQLPVVRLVALIVLAGALALAVTWRNLTNERLTLEVALQRSRTEDLQKEIQQLEGQIKVESSYGRIAKWALEKRGWRTAAERPGTVILRESALSPAAKQEADLMGTIHHERSVPAARP
jgi:cell division protein FtsL